MQYQSPSNTAPKTTRSVTPSPKFRKLEIDNSERLDGEHGGSYVQLIENCKNVKELGKLIKLKERIFKSSKCLRAMIRKLDQFKSDMNAKNAALLLNVCSKSRFETQHKELYRAIFALLSDVALANLHKASAKDISMTLHSLVKKNICNKKLFQRSSEYGMLIMDDFNPEGLSNMLLALAKMNCYSFEFFDRAAKAAISIMNDEDFKGDFNSQSLCFVADAFSRTKHYDAELFSAMLQKAIPFLDTFRPQDLVALIQAFANSGHDCKELFDATSKVIIEKVKFFNTGSLSRVAISFAQCGCKKPAVLDAIAEKELPFLHTLEAKYLSQLVSAFVEMNHYHEDLFEAATIAALTRMPAYEPSELVTITLAFSKMKGGVDAVFTAAAEAAELILDDFTPKEIGKLMDAFSKMGSFSESTDHLFCTIASRMLKNRSDMARWESKSLMAVAVAFSQGGVTNTNLMEEIGKILLKRADIFPAADATRIQRLITAFAGYETPSAVMIMEFVFREFMSLDKIDSSLIADIAMALPFGQRNDILPFGILKRISDVALSKGTKEEVFIIFEQFAKLGFDGIESHNSSGNCRKL